MRPTSEQQLEALTRGTLPEVEEVRPGLFAIALEMPGMRPPYAFCYAALSGGGSRAVHLIDAGLDSDANWVALSAALAGFDREITDVASVTVTHMHPDHTGLAWRIREASGAAVRMHERDMKALHGHISSDEGNDPAAMLKRWGVPEQQRVALLKVAVGPAEWGVSGPIDELLNDGDLIDLGMYVARVIHTPGHTGGHVCLAIDATEEGPAIVFTGDHVLPGINPGIGLGGERVTDPLGEYYASLDRLEPYTDAEVLPGHGFRFTPLGERCAEIRAHHERRTSEVAAVLGADPSLSVWQIATRITWSAGWDGLEDVTRLSALAQTEMHVARVRAIHTP